MLTNRGIEHGVAALSSPQERTADDVGDPSPTGEPQPHLKLDLARHITLTIAGFDVGGVFRRLQEDAAPLINDESVEVSINKLYLILYAYIEATYSRCIYVSRLLCN